METRKKYTILAGLAYIPGRCGAVEIQQILDKVLSEFDIQLQTDIVGIITDEPNVMKRFGQESPTEMVLCMNHTTHLAVMDVMYRQIDIYENDVSSDSESVYDLEDDFCVTDELENATNVSIRRDLKNVLKKTRKIVKYF
ncbi:unnamed protein product [Euphydryas editha]|uniref:Uncharacterized protein n=1 Tax=Euphydryas editha TaxID=104508 RepID=A0AAU9VBE5_EUPED|nr:unnamed protein product [Euphydryas editha]